VGVRGALRRHSFAMPPQAPLLYSSILGRLQMGLDSIFNDTCLYSPGILFILSLVYLRNKTNFILVYILGFIANALLNYILKGIFQHPRPTDEKHLFKMEQLHRKQIGFDRYGFPSNYAQSVLYSTVFINYTLKNPQITALFAVLSLFCLSQRVSSQSHSVIQVVAGALVGAGVGFFFYHRGEKYLKNIIQRKSDDNARR
jgi:membrane-associated phospholipid phosphatase